MAVRQVAAREIEKWTTLSELYLSVRIRALCYEGLRPERLGLVVIFYHAGLLPLEIYPRRAVIFDRLFEVCRNLCAVGFGRIFALQD